MTFRVTVPAANRMLASVDNVRLRGSIPEAVEDDAVELMIRSGSAWVESYCQRVFARETGVQTELLYGCYSRIFLERTPVISVTSVVEGGVTLTTDDYELDEQTGILRRIVDDAYSTWTGRVAVTYVGGYLLPDDVGYPTAAGSLPGDIEEAVILYIGQTQATSTLLSSQSSSSGGGTGIKRESVLNGLIDITYMSPAESSSTTQSSGSSGAQFAIRSLLDPYVRKYV